MPGSLTSRIRQLGPSMRALDKNSCALPKDLECKPTDSSNSWRDSRTSVSSSTMNTVGTSWVLITTRLNQKKAKNQMSRARLSSPIMRRLTTPDRLYRRMQCGSAKPRVEGETRTGGRKVQRGAFTGSGLISESSLEKLKSVGTLPVINRAPRLNVRSCIAH